MSEHGTIPGGEPPQKIARPRVLLPLALVFVVVLGVTLALSGGSSRTALPGGVQQSPSAAGFDGTLALPAKQAPPIELRNYQGQPVTLTQYRGKAVLVTFLYTHCPDVCPLIASNLRAALRMLGSRASRAQVIAISVDPRGDTPPAVATFLRTHEMLGRMQYLIGSPSQLSRTWAAWSVGSTREVGQPDRVAHSALVYGITATGTLKTLYPASFEPSEIAHDIPRLLAG
ncbi:MAG TPA: SCO family protein [Solirubrobacteraceae bacterium]|jgi:protein SCO1/2|nr:SCO family protein [Solirubrobacteraceae bacterium]